MSQTSSTEISKRLADVHVFYGLLWDLERRLGGARRLGETDGRSGWPPRGVYFFFENGEQRSDSGNGPRVVRVGTHALTVSSRTTLWKRLSNHRGPRRGVGNHRGSIFRLLIGAALMQRAGLNEPSSWGSGSDPGQAARNLGFERQQVVESELDLEESVSQYIGAMRVLWLGIDDPAGPKSLRGYIERNTIALLSNFLGSNVDPPSDEWLGRWSDRERVRGSGLWNQNHVEESHDPEFLIKLTDLVKHSGV